MPHKDPDKRRAANREAQRRYRQGGGLTHLAEKLKDAADLPEPPDRDELLKVLGVVARDGNTTAIRLLLEEYRRDGNDDSVTDHSSLAVVHRLRDAG